MKKRTAFIGALVSLMPIAQPLLIGSGAALTGAALILSLPEVANANRRAYFYFNRAFKKAEKGDDVGAIADYTKAIELDPADHNLQMLSFIYALVIPVLILGLLYLFIIENNGLPDWMERVSRNSGSVWTYGIIAIALVGILRYLIR